METAELINGILWLIVAMISLIPIFIFIRTYLKIKSQRILLISIAFILIFIKGITLALKLFFPGVDDEIWYIDDEFWWSVAAILDLIIIGLIVSALKRKE